MSSTYATPNDALYALQWHYRAMNLPTAWDTEDGLSPEVIVSVVDTGIVAHPELLPKTLPGYDFITEIENGGDGNGRDDDATDEGGGSDFHGSHVAGTIGAATNDGTGVAGVSWGAKILPVRVLGVDGTGTFDDIMAGIAWAAGRSVDGVRTNPNKARVINLSFGGDIGGACPSDANSFFASLASEGIIVVAAAGNSNRNVATSFPANCDGVITVGATGPGGERAPYSNYGTAIDLMAPGGDIGQSFRVGDKTYPAGVLSTVFDSTTNEYAYDFFQGTSMASPHVAGLVALLLAKEGNLTFDQVLSKLKTGSVALSSLKCGRPSSECGAGLVDAQKVLTGSSTPPPTTPTQKLTTYLLAFYCTTQQCEAPDLEQSKGFAFSSLNQKTPYTISRLAQGRYLIGAWQDLDGDGKPSDDEPLAMYETTIELGPGQSISGIDVQLTATNPQTAQFRSFLTKQVVERVLER